MIRNMTGECISPLLTDDNPALAALVKRSESNPDLLYSAVVDDQNAIRAQSEGNILDASFAFEKYIDPSFKIDNIEGRYYSWKGENILDLAGPVVITRGTKKMNLGRLHLGIDQKGISRVITLALGNMMAVTLFVLVFSLAVTSILAFLLVKPIQTLAAGVQKIGQGQFDQRIELKSKNEIGELAMAFNTMAGDLKYAQELQQKQVKLDQELALAAQIQKLLLPGRLPAVLGAEVGMVYRSAGQIGGDYLDLMILEKNRLGVCVADVAGKGIPAALQMVNVRSALRSLAKSQDSPKEVLCRLNASLIEDTTPNRFVTMIYGILDMDQGALVFASSGHCPLLLYAGPGKEVLQYRSTGLPLGIERGQVFESNLKEQKIQLEKGQSVVLYSDGITEAMNGYRQQYGDSRLCRALQNQAARSAQQIADGISEDVTEFVSGFAQSDDFSLIVVKKI